MVDAKFVKYDGSVVWASAEPELLWALRGGGGSFGGMTIYFFGSVKSRQEFTDSRN